jgi:hypothetical protein
VTEAEIAESVREIALCIERLSPGTVVLPSGSELEPAPCDGCWHAARCRSERLACTAFALFMDGAKPPRWSAVNRTPTRTRFTELLGA